MQELSEPTLRPFTASDGENRIAEPELADYFDAILKVTRGPLFTQERWQAIVRLNVEPAPPPR